LLVENARLIYTKGYISQKMHNFTVVFCPSLFPPWRIDRYKRATVCPRPIA
jgi:hypothetical protein